MQHYTFYMIEPYLVVVRSIENRNDICSLLKQKGFFEVLTSFIQN